MDYIFKEIEYSRQSLQLYADFLNFVFKGKILTTTDFLDWEYNQNPLGKAYGYNAFYGDKLVAHYSTQPLLCNIEGKITKGLLALHVATHPEHQRKGLFVIINDKTHEKAFNDGYEFVVGVANNNSTPGYIKSLGFKLIRQLDVRMGMSIPHKNINSKDEYSYSRIWNEECIKWRLKDPSFLHTVKEKNGVLTVFAPTHIKKISAIIYQMDKSKFINVEVNDKKRISILRIWLGIDNNLKWKSSIFLPEKLKPSPLNLIYVNFKDQNHQLDKNSILFNNIDFDAF